MPDSPAFVYAPRMAAAPRVVLTLASPFTAALAEVELSTLRAGFAELLERAAGALPRSGLDLDDVEWRRWLVCQGPAREESRVEVEWLADRDKFLASLADILENTPDVRIVGLRLEATAS